jgi:hypothetical protein
MWCNIFARTPMHGRTHPSSASSSLHPCMERMSMASKRKLGDFASPAMSPYCRHPRRDDRAWESHPILVVVVVAAFVTTGLVDVATAGYTQVAIDDSVPIAVSVSVDADGTAANVSWTTGYPPDRPSVLFWPGEGCACCPMTSRTSLYCCADLCPSFRANLCRCTRAPSPVSSASFLTPAYAHTCTGPGTLDKHLLGGSRASQRRRLPLQHSTLKEIPSITTTRG